MTDIVEYDIGATASVVIANGQTVSEAAPFYGLRLVGLITPAALTGTSVTFQGSVDGVTYVPIYDSAGVAITATVSTSRWTVLDPADFAGMAYIKVVSGSAEGAARTIVLIARPV